MERDKDPLDIAFGVALRHRRQQQGLSQERLAEDADLHRTYISQLERGIKSPSLRALWAIALALRCLPHELLKDVEDGLADGRK